MTALYGCNNAGLMRGELNDRRVLCYSLPSTVQKSIYHDAENRINPRIKNHVAACSISRLMTINI
jgi:hypothetical protein